jgi:hypothetical protein
MAGASLIISGRGNNDGKAFVELKLHPSLVLSLTASTNDHALVTNFRDFLAGQDLSIPANALLLMSCNLARKLHSQN